MVNWGQEKLHIFNLFMVTCILILKSEKKRIPPTIIVFLSGFLPPKTNGNFFPAKQEKKNSCEKGDLCPQKGPIGSPVAVTPGCDSRFSWPKK